MHYIYTSEYYSSIKRMEYCLLQQHGWTLDIIILSEKVLKMKMLVAHSCPTLCDTMDCSLTDSSVHGILQARILEWVAIAFSRGSSQPKDWTWISCTAGSLFTFWVTREAHTKWSKVKKKERQIPYDIIYMWNLKYNTNELIYETETDSQTQKTDVWLLKGGMDWEFGISRCKLLYRKDKQTGPTI